MKKTIVLLAATTLLLGACGNEKEETKKENEVVEQELAKNETEEVETAEKEQIELSEEDKQKDKQEDKQKENPKEHNHDEFLKFELKAEDIIVTYFNAISLKDFGTLELINPNAIEENAQYQKLFEISNVKTDVRDMKKISVNEKEAEYRILVELFTVENDENFTNNVSEYTLKIDLENGTFKSKQVSIKEFLE